MLSLVAPTNLFLGRGARKVEFFRVDVVSGSSYQLFWVGKSKNVEFFWDDVVSGCSYQLFDSS